MSDSNGNNFLKNLSQKKYSWMEAAISSIPAQSPLSDSSSNTTTSATTTKHKPKKQKLSPEPKQQQAKKPEPTIASPAASVAAVTAEDPPTEKKRKQPLFKYTTFPVKGYNILPTRNITSTYARNDVSYFSGSKAGAEEIAPSVTTTHSSILPL